MAASTRVSWFRERGGLRVGLRPRLIIGVAMVSFVGLLAGVANWKAFGEVQSKVNGVLQATMPDLRDALLRIDIIHRLEGRADSFFLVTTEADRKVSYAALVDEVVTAGELIDRVAHQGSGHVQPQREELVAAVSEENRLVFEKLSLSAALESRLGLLVHLDNAIDVREGALYGEKEQKQTAQSEAHEYSFIFATMEDLTGLLFRMVAQKDGDLAPFEQQIAIKVATLDQWRKSTSDPTALVGIPGDLKSLFPLAVGPDSIPDLCGRLSRNRQQLADASRDTGAKIETLSATATAIASGAEAQSEETSRMTLQALGDARNAIVLTVPITFFGTLLVLWIGLGRKVIDRLTGLAEVTRRLAVGHLDTPIPVEGRDELTDISESLLRFRQWAIEKRRVEEQLKKTIESVQYEKDLVEAQAVELVALAERGEQERRAAVASRRIAQENEDKLRSVLDNVPDGIVIIDGDGTIQSFSPAAQRLFGYAAAAVVGESVNILMPAEAADRHTERLNRYYQDGSRDIVGHGMRQVIARHADGRHFSVDISVNGAIIGGRSLLVSSVRDARARLENEAALRVAKDEAENALAELKQTQRSLIQAEKFASLGAVVAGVAHEINTPVSNCLTSASTLVNETAETVAALTRGSIRKSELRRYFDAADELARLILSNMHRAAELVSSFKRLSVDQTTEVRRRFLLHQCIDDVLFTLQPQLRQKGCFVEVHCPDGLEVDGYPGALSQVLTNLVTNVLIHALVPDRPGRITIDVDHAAGDDVTLRFVDNGSGIAKAQLGRIFEPFFTTKRSAGGTGLGLHLVHNLVTTALVGQIRVDSEEHHGTAFTILFPRCRPPVTTRTETNHVEA